MRKFLAISTFRHEIYLEPRPDIKASPQMHCSTGPRSGTLHKSRRTTPVNICMLDLWVVRYRNGIGAKNHELALVYPSSGISEVNYIFGSRTAHSSVQLLQKTSIFVDKTTIEKRMYNFVFHRDIQAVKAAAFLTLNSQVCSHHLYLMSSVLTSRNLVSFLCQRLNLQTFFAGVEQLALSTILLIPRRLTNTSANAAVDAGTSVNAATDTAVNAAADANTSVNAAADAAATDAAVNAAADANTSVNAATDAAATDAAVNAAADANTSVNAATDANTSVNAAANAAEMPDIVDANIAVNADKIEAFKQTYKRTSGTKKHVVRAFDQWKIKAEDCFTDIYSSNALDKLENVIVIDASDPNKVNDINALLKKKNLGPLSEIQIQQSVHYGMYDANGKLVTVMTTTQAYVKTYSKVVIMVDWLIGIDDTHNASYMVDGLKDYVGQKELRSYVCTQSWNNRKATRFWTGKLTQSNYACVLVGLFYIFNEDFRIYQDVTCMCT